MSDQIPRSEAREWLMAQGMIAARLEEFDRRFPPPAPPLPACPYCEEPRAVHEFTTGWCVQCKPSCYVGPSAPTKAAAIRLVTLPIEIAKAEGRLEMAEFYADGKTGVVRVGIEQGNLRFLRAELTALKEHTK